MPKINPRLKTLEDLFAPEAETALISNPIGANKITLSKT